MSVMAHPYQRLLNHINDLMEDTLVPQVFAEARKQFLAGKPRSLAALLRQELKFHELAAGATGVPPNVRLGAETSARFVQTLLEELAAQYGNVLIWGSDSNEREEDQDADVITYVAEVIGQTSDRREVVKLWHGAADSFAGGDIMPLLRLVSGMEGYDACHIANIFMARLAG